jgi:hypothetical protein
LGDFEDGSVMRIWFAVNAEVFRANRKFSEESEVRRHFSDSEFVLKLKGFEQRQHLDLHDCSQAYIDFGGVARVCKSIFPMYFIFNFLGLFLINFIFVGIIVS